MTSYAKDARGHTNNCYQLQSTAKVSNLFANIVAHHVQCGGILVFTASTRRLVYFQFSAPTQSMLQTSVLIENAVIGTGVVFGLFGYFSALLLCLLFYIYIYFVSGHTLHCVRLDQLYLERIIMSVIVIIIKRFNFTTLSISPHFLR